MVSLFRCRFSSHKFSETFGTSQTKSIFVLAFLPSHAPSRERALKPRSDIYCVSLPKAAHRSAFYFNITQRNIARINRSRSNTKNRAAPSVPSIYLKVNVPNLRLSRHSSGVQPCVRVNISCVTLPKGCRTTSCMMKE